MTRHRFGGDLASWVFSFSSSAPVLETSMTITFWSAATGGTQHGLSSDAAGTDFFNEVTTADGPTAGQIPVIYGPDGVTWMWASAAGHPRALITANDLAEPTPGVALTIFDAKGDLVVATGPDTVARLPVGSAGDVLTVDSTTATGAKWAPPASGGGSGASTLPSTIFVAASTASTAEKALATATYTCDGTADNVQINAAVAAVKAAGGGRVVLSAGTFNLAAAIALTGNDNAGTSPTQILQGAGHFNTFLVPTAGVHAIAISMIARVQILDLGFKIDGASSAITATAAGSALHRSFDESLFANLYITGQYSTHTGWAVNLGSPFRSLMHNWLVSGVKNGIRLYSEDATQNPGDCTFNRMIVGLYNPSGTAGVAYSLESPAGQLNQIEFVMCEAFIDTSVASYGTAFYLGGTNGVTHCKFHGVNAEQFATIWWVESGEGNVFDANFITCADGVAGTSAFNFGASAYNNRVDGIGMFYSAVANKLVTSTATSITQPNIIEHIKILADTGATVTNSIGTAGSLVSRDIVAEGAGTAATVLRSPSVTAPSTVVTLTDGASIATNAALGNHFRVTLGGNRTLANPTGMVDGQRVIWEIIQDSTGSRAITLGSAFALGTDITAVTLTTTASKRDFLGAIYNATTAKWTVVALSKGF